MATLLFHKPTCSTSRRVLGMLQQADVDFDTVLYLNTPLDRVALVDLISRLEDPSADLVRRDGTFKDLNLTSADVATDDQVADVLARHPELMQRPTIDDGTIAFIGRPVDRVDAWLANL